MVAVFFILVFVYCVSYFVLRTYEFQGNHDDVIGSWERIKYGENYHIAYAVDEDAKLLLKHIKVPQNYILFANLDKTKITKGEIIPEQIISQKVTDSYFINGDSSFYSIFRLAEVLEINIR